MELRIDFETFDKLDLPDITEEIQNMAPIEILELSEFKEEMIRNYPEYYIGYIWFTLLNRINGKKIYISVISLGLDFESCQEDLKLKIKYVQERNRWFNNYFQKLDNFYLDDINNDIDCEYEIDEITGNIESMRGSFENINRMDPYWRFHYGYKISREIYNTR